MKKGRLFLIMCTEAIIQWGCSSEVGSSDEPMLPVTETPPIAKDTIGLQELVQATIDSLKHNSDGSVSNEEFTIWPDLGKDAPDNLGWVDNELPEFVLSHSTNLFLKALDGIDHKQFSDYSNYFLHSSNNYTNPDGVKMFNCGWRIKNTAYPVVGTVSFTVWGIYNDSKIIFSRLSNDLIGTGRIDLYGIEKRANSYYVHGNYETVVQKQFGAFTVTIKDGKVTDEAYMYIKNE